MLFAVLAGQQRGHWMLLPAMLLCLMGVVCITLGEGAWSVAIFCHHLQRNPVGYGMAFIAAITWAVYSVFTRRFGNGVNGVPLFLVITAGVLWLAYALSNQSTLVFHLAGFLQVAVMGVLMATAYSCWNYSIQYGNLAVLATMSYFTPVLSALLASVWLGVQPNAGFVYGVGLVTLGSFLSGRASKVRSSNKLPD